MKYLLLITLFPTLAFAQYNRCQYHDVVLTYNCSLYNIDPPVSFVKENDRICVKLVSADGSRQTLLVQGQPVYLKATADKSDEAGFIAKKIGDIEVRCGQSKATIKVQSTAEFNKKEDEYYRYDSHMNRRNNTNTQDYNHRIRRYGR